MILIAGSVAILLTAIAALHVYWAAGGRWGASAAVPEVAGVSAFRPGPAATLAVAGLRLYTPLCLALTLGCAIVAGG